VSGNCSTIFTSPRDQKPPAHGGYTQGWKTRDGNGHYRSPRVRRNSRSGRQHSRHQATLQEAGRSSSLPTRLTGALRAAANDAVVIRTGLTLQPSWSRRRQARASSFLPAVPPTCHKQRSRAVPSGQSRSLGHGRWAGCARLTWAARAARNCMACKGSHRDCIARYPVPFTLLSCLSCSSRNDTYTTLASILHSNYGPLDLQARFWRNRPTVDAAGGKLVHSGGKAVPVGAGEKMAASASAATAAGRGRTAAHRTRI